MFIFLDIDGVLNTRGSFDHLQHRWLGDVIGSDIMEAGLIANLKMIIEETGAKCVLSSSWKFQPADLKSAASILFSHGIEIIDITPECPAGSCRGDEIEAWMLTHGQDKPYVIIDDIDDFLESQQGRIVITNDRSGLTEEKAMEAIRCLRKS